MVQMAALGPVSHFLWKPIDMAVPLRAQCGFADITSLTSSLPEAFHSFHRPQCSSSLGKSSVQPFCVCEVERDSVEDSVTKVFEYFLNWICVRSVYGTHRDTYQSADHY